VNSPAVHRGCGNIIVGQCEAITDGARTLLVGPERGFSYVEVSDCTEFYVTIGMRGWSRRIALANIEMSHDGEWNCLELQERYR